MFLPLKGNLCYSYANQGDLTAENQFVKIVKCFIGIFDRIKALHDFGFTNCDIRLANILILEDDTPPHNCNENRLVGPFAHVGSF